MGIEEDIDQQLLRHYKRDLFLLDNLSPRSAHSKDDKYLYVQEGANSFHRHHQQLKGLAENADELAVSIRQHTGPLAQTKRFFKEHILLRNILQWTLFGTIVCVPLFLTAGLGPLPLLFGIYLVAFGGAAAWYGLAKPVALWCAEKYYYPEFSLRTIHQPDENQDDIHASPHLMVEGLGVSEPDNNPILTSQINYGRSVNGKLFQAVDSKEKPNCANEDLTSSLNYGL